MRARVGWVSMEQRREHQRWFAAIASTLTDTPVDPNSVSLGGADVAARLRDAHFDLFTTITEAIG